MEDKELREQLAATYREIMRDLAPSHCHTDVDVEIEHVGDWTRVGVEVTCEGRVADANAREGAAQLIGDPYEREERRDWIGPSDAFERLSPDTCVLEKWSVLACEYSRTSETEGWWGYHEGSYVTDLNASGHVEVCEVDSRYYRDAPPKTEMKKEDLLLKPQKTPEPKPASGRA